MRACQFGWLAAAIAVTATSACERGPEPQEIGPAVEQTPDTTAATQQSALQDLLQTGLGGEVHFTPHADRLEIHVAVTDGVAESTMPARVQAGTCENPGAEVAVLEAVRTGALGNGTSTSTVEHAPAQLMDGNHVVAVYASGGVPGADRPAGCSPIPLRQ